MVMLPADCVDFETDGFASAMMSAVAFDGYTSMMDVSVIDASDMTYDVTPDGIVYGPIHVPVFAFITMIFF